MGKIGDIMQSLLWNDDKIFIIAEIGSNHNGDLKLCKKMIIKAKECGADAVKLQKRYNDQTFTKAILNVPYQSEYAQKTGTYREHREYLDRFDMKEFRELKKLADDIGIILFATPFDFKSVDFLASLDMPLYKVASCDFRNIPLIEYIAQLEKPMLLSTGGADYSAMDFVYRKLLELDVLDFAFLYCVSKYPNSDTDLNLNCIAKMKEKFPCPIGFSSHHPGLWPLSSAYHAGARIFEMHFTFNRAWANINRDHAFSFEPQALRKACFDLKRIPTMMGDGERVVSEEEKKGFVWKFGKAIHLACQVRKGEILTADKITIKAPADGIEPYRINEIIGKIITTDCSTTDTLTEDLLR